jgi:hypothetical protein
MMNNIYVGEQIATKILKHYASEYYDPVKAREYYLRTRELKGRRSTRKLTKAGREVWKVAKSEIDAEKKTTYEDARETQKKEVTVIREKAKKKREALAAKIKKAMLELTSDTKAKIEAVPKVPKGLPKEARAKAAEERRKKIEKIRGESKQERKESSNKGRADRLKISADLKGSVEKARANYEQIKERIKADYEQKYQSEFDAIRTSV